MSTSLKVVSIAAVCCASTSRRAIVWRRLVIRIAFLAALGCRCDARFARRCDLLSLVGATGVGARFVVGAIGFAGRCDGVLHVLLRDAAGGARTLHAFEIDVVIRGDAACSRRRARWLRCRLGFRPSIRCPTVPPGQLLPARALPFRRPLRRPSPAARRPSRRRLRLLDAGELPAWSAPTSRSIFSVSSSTTGSPVSTRSPSFFSQRATRASTTDSPSCGTTMLAMAYACLESTIDGSSA